MAGFEINQIGGAAPEALTQAGKRFIGHLAFPVNTKIVRYSGCRSYTLPDGYELWCGDSETHEEAETRILDLHPNLAQYLG